VTPASCPRVAVYAGPSVTPAAVHAAFEGVPAEVQVLPPIRQGDLLARAHDLPDVVAVIDGFFFQVPSVQHKELLLAVERGARVLGAASMGALRAAELDGLGMEGVGEVFRLYRSGEVEADDEVALLHLPAEFGFRAMTEALVSVRHNLSRARAAGAVSPGFARSLLATAAGLHFTGRTAPALRQAAERDPRLRREWEAWEAFLHRDGVDVKHQDALALLRTVAARLRGEAPWPDMPRQPLAVTVYLHAHERRYGGAWVDGVHVPLAPVVSLVKLASPSAPRLAARAARRSLAYDEALEQGLEPDPPGVLVDRFSREREIGDEGALGEWLRRRHLARADLEHWLAQRQLEARVLAAYGATGRAGRAGARARIARAVASRLGIAPEGLEGPLYAPPGIPWDAPLAREMKVRGHFARAAELAARANATRAALEADVPGLGEALGAERLTEWVARRWKVNAQQVEGEALRRGFTGWDELLETARLLYVHQRFASATV
jgi:hypothetical protein